MSGTMPKSDDPSSEVDSDVEVINCSEQKQVQHASAAVDVDASECKVAMDPVAENQNFRLRMEKYEYAIAQFEDDIFAMPTGWFTYDEKKGWGAMYPEDKYGGHRYVSKIKKIEDAGNVIFTWHRIRRRPHIKECGQG